MPRELAHAIATVVALAFISGCSASNPVGTSPSSADAGGGSGDAGAWVRATDAGTSYVYATLDSTSAPDGGVVVYVSWPNGAAAARYAAGAPVVIWVPGGSTAGGMPPPGSPDISQYGFVSVRFMFSGGTSSGGTTAGVYDYRGPGSMRILADVVKFATGQLTVRVGTPGWSLSGITGYPVATNNVGLLALSNGGNVAIATMAEHGAELVSDAGRLAWYIGWENPMGDHMLTNLLTQSMKVNPYYTLNTCGPDLCTISTSNLVYLAGAQQTLPDPAGGSPLTLPGTVFYDVDSNGIPDGSVDHIVEPWVARLPDGGPLAGFLAIETLEFFGAGVWSSGVPAGFATVPQARAFWPVRDVGSPDGGKFASAVQKLPSIGVMVMSSDTDHVQRVADHPHIKTQLDGWREAGATFVRLNPDAVYAAQFDAGSTVDNAANKTWAWIEIDAGALYPDTASDTLMEQAAAAEMADRVQFGIWSANLDSAIAR